MSKSYDLGRKGEALAAEYLESKGVKILERNFRAGKAEIDIIALDKGILAIIEVKTRQTRYFGEPEQWVTPAKQRLLVKAANAFIKYKHFRGEVRFDVISVVAWDEKTEISHIPDAFYPVMK
jgi:putative endonuclease